MAEWPDVEELKQVLNVDSTDWDDTLERVLASAIAFVQRYTGGWEDGDEPDDRLAQAALRMGELMSQRPGVMASDLARDPAFRALMFGQRQRFGVA